LVNLCTLIGKVLTSCVVPYSLVAIVGLIVIVRMDTGLADNGDFTRAAIVFTSRPVDIYPNWPDAYSNAELWQRRFFNFYIPWWRLDFPQPLMANPFKSSSYILWFPGVAINMLFWSQDVLSISIMSIPARILLIVIYIVLIKYIRHNYEGIRHLILLFAAAVPAALILTSYSLYLNSFYFESGGLIFGLLFAVSVGWFALSVRRKWLVKGISLSLVLTSATLIATAKVQWIYMPVLSLVALVVAWRREHSALRVLAVVPLLTAAVALSVGSYLAVRPPDETLEINAYHRVFYGVLILSSRSQDQLVALEMADAAGCVGVSAFAASGPECVGRTRGRFTLGTVIRIIAQEPGLLVRMLEAAADRMHVVKPPYLGTLRRDDPRITFGAGTGLLTVEDFWPRLKLLFPRGSALFVWVVACGLICYLVASRGSGPVAAIALAGVVSALATLVDMFMAIIGDGLYELEKHLFMANLMFDITTICTVVLVLIYLCDAVSAAHRWMLQQTRPWL